ncbi:polysaccharide lyase family 8 super-sandwich domain-containing protein [Propionibacteriaceae bacterium Y2011]
MTRPDGTPQDCRTTTSTPDISRRALLGAAGAATGLGLTAGSWWAPGARAQEVVDFATLRARYRELLIGTDFDTSDPLVAAGIQTVSEASATVRATLVAGADRDRVFSDRPFTTSGNHTVTYGNLQNMAKAYRTPGADGFEDETLLQEILAGLCTTHDLVYHAGADEWDNWWHWEIGSPVSLMGVLCLLDGLVPPAEVAQYVEAVTWFVPDPAWQWTRYPNRGTLESTGTNRVDLCRNVFLAGIVGESDEHMDLAADRLGVAFRYGSEGDPDAGFYAQQGFYPDGSFLYQGRVPYTGSYAVDYLTGLSRLLGMLAGSPWEIDDPRVSNVIESVERGIVPIVFSGQVMDGVRGRSISRVGTPSYSYGNTFVEGILRLAPAADAATAVRWRNICAGWLERNTVVDILDGANLPRISVVKALLEDSTVTPTPERSGFRVFPSMARATHRGAGWGLMITAASDRVSIYDYQLGENYKGFHTASGMVQVYSDDDPAQFSNNFWPTVNLYGLPGTTLDTKPLPKGSGGGGAGKTLAPNAWAGGVTLDDEVGTFGQHLHGVSSTMRAHQSWFCLPDRIVALGAGITGGSEHPVITTVEHRNLHTDGTNALTVNGTVQPTDLGWTDTFDPGSWAHLESTGGYLALDGTVPLHAGREERTGSWRDINDNSNASPDPITHRYVNLWFDHGPDPDPREIVVDTHAAPPAFEKVGSWVETTSVRGVNGGSVLATSPGHAGSARAIWRPTVPRAGRYEAAVWFPHFHNNPPTAPYSIAHAGGVDVVTISQQTGGGTWQVLGEYDFAAGPAEIVMEVDGSGFPKADAVRLRSLVPPDPADARHYAYVQLPRATVTATAAAAADPGVAVLSNTPEVQAVAVAGDSGVLANFFAAGSVRRVAADGPCAVALSIGDVARLAVSDPTGQRDSVELRVKLGALARVRSGDSTVTIARTNAEVTVTVDTSDRDGRTHRVDLAR